MFYHPQCFIYHIQSVIIDKSFIQIRLTMDMYFKRKVKSALNVQSTENSGKILSFHSLHCLTILKDASHFLYC